MESYLDLNETADATDQLIDAQTQWEHDHYVEFTFKEKALDIIDKHDSSGDPLFLM